MRRAHLLAWALKGLTCEARTAPEGAQAARALAAEAAQGCARLSTLGQLPPSASCSTSLVSSATFSSSSTACAEPRSAASAHAAAAEHCTGRPFSTHATAAGLCSSSRAFSAHAAPAEKEEEGQQQENLGFVRGGFRVEDFPPDKASAFHTALQSIIHALHYLAHAHAAGAVQPQP